jgi:hypothetical protein
MHLAHLGETQNEVSFVLESLFPSESSILIPSTADTSFSDHPEEAISTFIVEESIQIESATQTASGIEVEEPCSDVASDDSEGSWDNSSESDFSVRSYSPFTSRHP